MNSEKTISMSKIFFSTSFPHLIYWLLWYGIRCYTFFNISIGLVPKNNLYPLSITNESLHVTFSWRKLYQLFYRLHKFVVLIFWAIFRWFSYKNTHTMYLSIEYTWNRLKGFLYWQFNSFCLNTLTILEYDFLREFIMEIF